MSRVLPCMQADEVSGVHLWLVLMKAHQALERHAEGSIEATGLCFTDFTLLEMLLHRGPLPVNTLARRFGLTSGSATTAIDRLAKRGFVTREFDAKDRRTRVVHLTESGRKLIAEAFAKHAQAMEEPAGSLSTDERKLLLSLLRKLGKWQIVHESPSS